MIRFCRTILTLFLLVTTYLGFITLSAHIPSAYADTFNPGPALRLPWNGPAYPIIGFSYGCGDHQDNRKTQNYDDSYAIDFGLPQGTPVTAVADGIVRSASFPSGVALGNYVYVEHTLADHKTLSGFVSLYGHLSNNQIVPSGTFVTQGTTIGISGNTGHSSGAHLHFSLRANYNGSNLWGNSQTGAYSIPPEPMSGYTGFKHYGVNQDTGCTGANISMSFDPNHSMTRQTLLESDFSLYGISPNQHVQRTSSWVTITIYNLNNQVVANFRNQATYVASTGRFLLNLDLGLGFTSGFYYINTHMDNTLDQSHYFIHIYSGLAVINPLTLYHRYGVVVANVISGDINNDTQVDLLDYNILLSCFGSKTCSYKTQSDLNDDGAVDGADYNIFLWDIGSHPEGT